MGVDVVGRMGVAVLKYIIRSVLLWKLRGAGYGASYSVKIRTMKRSKIQIERKM